MKEKGYILLGMLLMMVLVAVTAAALNRRAGLQARMATNDAQAVQTSFGQEAAIEEAVWQLTQDPCWRTVAGGEDFLYNGVTYNRKVLNSTIGGHTNCITVSVTAPGGQKPLRTSFDYYAYQLIPDPTVIGPPSALSPMHVTRDSMNNIYCGDLSNDVIWKRDASSGEWTVVAGTFYGGFSGDGGPATSAKLNMPYGAAVDTLGNIYIADTHNNRIRKVDTTGTITTVAGTGSTGYNGDSQPATDATLYNPYDVAVDAAGNIYIADTGNTRVRMVDTSGTIHTFAGTGNAGHSGDEGPATDADLCFPYGIALSQEPNVLYVADTQNHIIRKVDATGIITTVAGQPERAGYRTDCEATGTHGGKLDFPADVFVDAAGDIYIVERDNHTIRFVDLSANWISTMAGDGTAGSGTAGDGGPATDARFDTPWGVCLDTSGEVIVGDTQNRRIRHFYPGGTIDSYDMPETPDGPSQPNGIALDSNGNLYIADMLNDRILKADPSGNFITVAGTGVGGFSGDNGPAINAMLNSPYDVAVDSAGNLYISDSNNHRVRKVDSSGIITTFAGNGTQGYSGDGGPATMAMLDTPYGIDVDTSGILYIADWFNHRIRKVDMFGTINTVAGTGNANYSGEGTATANDLKYPKDVFVDTVGNIYIADTDNDRIRKVDTSGIISTVAGNGTRGYNGDGMLATDASLSAPRDVFADLNGHIFITDEYNCRIRLVSANDGIIRTIAGTGTNGFNGNDQPAILSDLGSPRGIAMPAIRGAGRIYFSDCGNNMIRKLGFHVVAELY